MTITKNKTGYIRETKKFIEAVRIDVFGNKKILRIRKINNNFLTKPLLGEIKKI